MLLLITDHTATSPPQPLYRYEDINISSLSGLATHIQISHQVQMYMYTVHYIHVHVQCMCLCFLMRVYAYYWAAYTCTVHLHVHVCTMKHSIRLVDINKSIGILFFTVITCWLCRQKINESYTCSWEFSAVKIFFDEIYVPNYMYM